MVNILESAEKISSSSSVPSQGTANEKTLTEQPTERSNDAGKTSQDESIEEIQYVTGFALYIVCGALTMATFLLLLDSTVVATAIPRITSDFNSLKDIGWYGSAYLFSTCSLQLLSGKIYQFYNSKIVFISALLIFELGSLICGASRSSHMFIVGRAIAGCGGAGLLNGCLTIISASAPLEKRPPLLGILIGLSSIGMAAGPLIGGGLTQHASWRWCFYLNLPIGGLTIALLTFIRIPDARVKDDSNPSIMHQIDRLDLPGCAIFIPATIMLLLGLTWGGVREPWNSATIIGLFCGSAATYCIFFFWESRRGESAVLPLSVLRNSILSCAAIGNLTSQGGFFLISYYLPVWFQVVKNATPTMSGVYVIAIVLSQIVTSVTTGFLVPKIGYYTPFMIAGCVTAAISAGLMTTFTQFSPRAAWIGYQVLNGFSRGLILQQPLTAAQANVPQRHMAIASALIAFCQFFGPALFVSLGQTVFQNMLWRSLARFAPEVDPHRIISVGATSFRTVISPSSVPGVVLAYNKALTATFYLAVGAACVAFVVAWGFGWTSLKTKKKAESAET